MLMRMVMLINDADTRTNQNIMMSLLLPALPLLLLMVPMVLAMITAGLIGINRLRHDVLFSQSHNQFTKTD